MNIHYFSLEGVGLTSDLTVLNCGFEECESSHFFGPAIRNYYLLHFVHSGSGIFRNGSGEHKVTKGGIFLINPSELTYYCACENDPWTYSWVGFDGLKANKILIHIGFTENIPVLYTQQTDKTAELFDFINNIASTGIESELGCIGALYHMLYLFQKPMKSSLEFSRQEVLNSIRQTIYFFDVNYPYDIKIQKVASNVGLDRTSLFRAFKREFGISPQEYLIRFRIGKACELLSKTNLSVSEIATSVGMENAAHFSTIFKKHLGLSPREYRKSIIL